MPKISAPTVAEHRAAQRAALIAAAELLIAADGVSAITPRSVCERAGLARSSFYEYFPSKDDLLAAIAMRAFDEWTAELTAAVGEPSPSRERLHRYVETTVRMTADGKHRLALGLLRTELSPKNVESIMAMHDGVTAPLRELLEDMGVSDPAAQSVLVQGVISAGMQLVGQGMSAREVADSITSLLDRGVRG